MYMKQCYSDKNQMGERNNPRAPLCNAVIGGGDGVGGARVLDVRDHAPPYD